MSTDEEHEHIQIKPPEGKHPVCLKCSAAVEVLDFCPDDDMAVALPCEHKLSVDQCMELIERS